ncbi:TetR/AcrR family transcriptional regulator [Oscillatoria sp. FACHB-1407]|uniref:TetR family transcriptional regulator n=1 Tax=Oscillatoria sp. FACHB-1407 TaxID=2692847 RepID=UPI00168248D6|nr:TetR family transcriptional regulator [Oscillatoria sp. FACHB-1407]MBD2463788.1 TetR/AcrR family transcriptional regulator [Oscillatoria sp. FACHB-1407]
MGKPTSSLSTAISIRLPNDLLQAINDLALERGFVNTSGRSDKRGQPNLSAVITDLLRQSVEDASENSPTELSDSVINALEPLEDRLVDRLTEGIKEAISIQLDAFLSDLTERTTDGAYRSPVSKSLPAATNIAVKPIDDVPVEDTKTRIMKAIHRGFRSRGYNGVGVDALAKDAGVTSGAFYGYFRSKEEAFLAAVIEGLDEYRTGVETFRKQNGEQWVTALADYYVGSQHRQNIACGCALPTLSPEVIRASDRVRKGYERELVKLHGAVAAGLKAKRESEKHDLAWAILSLLTGGLTLARAVADENLAEQISDAVHQATVAIANNFSSS